MKSLSHSIRNQLLACLLGAVVISCSSIATADPCGMVPPIYTGEGSPITRVGLQQTYVFFDDGVESFVIRPGFQGKVDNFGMLIPFPSVPSIRKVSDNVFQQIDNAVDPPEVVVDLRVQMFGRGGGFGGGGVGGGGMQPMKQARVRRDQVVVLKEEAVGMYQVAVLAAGSAQSLKKWMDEHKFQYPKGMDDVTEDYVKAEWCFVAVKTKVADKAATDPQPGQRNVKADLKSNVGFDGAVQGMGFRFRTKELIVPMRLSAFNKGELRNVVYLLSKGGKRIKMIPEEYVVRQVRGKQLVRNMTELLPLRVIGGRASQIPEWQRKNLPQRRAPGPKNGVALQLFADDIRAVDTPDLTLEHEETEKEMAAVSEFFQLRGAKIDSIVTSAISEVAKKDIDAIKPKLAKFTLTVVDGDFPREVIANHNLTFAKHYMPADRNNAKSYDSKLHGPTNKKEGRLYSVAEPWNLPSEKAWLEKQMHASNNPSNVGSPVAAGIGVVSLALLVRRRKRN